MKKTLLIIDPQNDFCEKNETDISTNKPALAVPGSGTDMRNIINFIKNNELDEIVVTLDTHSIIDIAHPMWWKKNNGDYPEIFTMISLEDIEKGLYTTSNPEHFEYSKNYIKSLEEQGKYKLIIWPEHCIQGTWGHNIYSELMEEIIKWSRKNNKNAQFFYKGTNEKTEHYSALKAEIVLDKNTDLNENLLNLLIESDKLYVCGEALSHCVASTVKDLINNSDKSFHKNIFLLKNCTSSVAGFEKYGDDFINYLKGKGSHVI